MWRNPKYVEPEPVAGPVENGTNLVTLSRGPGEQLRITLSEFNGSPFISLRVWTAGSDDVWYPAKGRGVSVRVREIVAVGRALAEALRLLRGEHRPALTDARRPAVQDAGRGGGGLRVDRSVGSPGGRADGPPSGRQRPSWQPERLPPAEGGAGFSEFEE